MKISSPPPWLEQDALFSESARNSFSYRLFLLSKLVNSTIEMHLQARFQLGLREAHLMALLTRHPEMHSKDLVGIAGIDKALVSRSLATLIRQQLIEAVPDPADHRLRTYAFTASGREVRDELRVVVRDLNQGLLEMLNEPQRGQLNELMDQLSRAAMSRYRNDRQELERRPDQTDRTFDEDHVNALGAALSNWRKP